MANGKSRNIIRRITTATTLLTASSLLYGCLGLRQHIRGIDERPFQTYTQVAPNQYMHFVKVGQNTQTPLILVHGIGGSTAEWYTLADILKENYTVYIPVLPGFGDSDNIPGQKTFQDIIPSFMSFMDENGIRRANAVFHSFSGDLGRRLKNQYPDRFGTVFLLDTYIPGHIQLNRGIQGHITTWPLIGDVSRFIAQITIGEERCGDIMRKYSRDRNKITAAHAREAWRNLQSSEDFKTFFEMARNYIPEENNESCQDIIIIRGANDNLTQLINSDFQEIQVYIIPECGHWPQIERPNELADIIKEELEH